MVRISLSAFFFNLYGTTAAHSEQSCSIFSLSEVKAFSTCDTRDCRYVSAQIIHSWKQKKVCSSYLSSKYFGSKERPFPGHCQINPNAFWWRASLQHHPLCRQPVCQLPLGIQDTTHYYVLMSSKERCVQLEQLINLTLYSKSCSTQHLQTGLLALSVLQPEFILVFLYFHIFSHLPHTLPVVCSIWSDS